jgi:pyruvate, orthophosphate dikinase
VVSGLVKTLPISIKQQDEEMRDTDIILETHFPEIYNALEKMAKELIYKKGWSPQEMEFTFEGPTVDKLYILQTRDMAIRGRKEVFKFDLEQNPKGAMLLGHGIGVAGGAMSGRVVFSLDEIDRWRLRSPILP